MAKHSSGSKRHSLATALKNHQTRVDSHQRARTAYSEKQAAAKNKAQGKGRVKKPVHPSSSDGTNGRGKVRQESTLVKYTIPYKKDDRILLIGEGQHPLPSTASSNSVKFCAWLTGILDAMWGGMGSGNFSFALSLLTNHLPRQTRLAAQNLTATAFDTEPECYRKYPQDAEANVASLRKAGVQVFFGVDATRLSENRDIRRLRQETYGGENGWNKIVFNFPHAGGLEYISASVVSLHCG